MLQLRSAISKVWKPLSEKQLKVRSERDRLKVEAMEKRERLLEEEYLLQRLRRAAAVQVWHCLECVCCCAPLTPFARKLSPPPHRTRAW